MITWICCAAALQAAPVQDPPPPIQTTAAPDQAPSILEEVVVEGSRSDARAEIDRRTYRVTNALQVQTSTTLEILAQIPSVTVTPAGRVQLLGNAGVTILVDGRPPVSSDATLRSLPASQIDRIEVMTNPSAQFSAQGTAGIINIITVRRTLPGWTGTMSASGNSLGGGQLAFSPALTRGKWTVEGALSLARQAAESSGSTYRIFVDPIGGQAEELQQDEDAESTEDRLRVSSRVRYRATPRDTVSVSAEAVSRGSERVTLTEASGFEPFVERIEAPDRSEGASASVDYERTGPLDGESLKASASLDHLDWTLENQASVDYGATALADGRYETLTEIRNENAGLKVDYVRPIGSSSIISSGLSWTSAEEDKTQSLRILEGVGPGPAALNEQEAVRNLTAVYGTVQFPVAGWTTRPGLRIEYNVFEVQASGLSTRIDDVSVFPSFHLRREMSDDLTVNLSYSRRINRPDAQRLNPFIVFSSNTSARAGNPDLQPEFTNAFEARIEYRRDGFSLDTTLYVRETSDTWSESTERLSDLVFLTTQINTGERSERGAEFSARGQLGAQWKYVVTTNLFVNSQDVLEGGRLQPRDDFSYTATTQLEYRTAPSDGALPDEFQASVRHFGPSQFYDRRTSSFTQVDLTWRHPISRSLSLVTTASDVFNSSGMTTRLVNDELEELVEYRGAGTTLRTALVYRFN